MPDVAFQLPLFRPESRWKPPTEPPNLAGAKLLSLDVESYDPDLKKLGPGFHRDAHLIGLAIGTDTGIRSYMPVRHQGGGNCSWDVIGWARETLPKFDGEVVGAHLIYDQEGLALDWGIKLTAARGLHDVLLAEPVLDEWRMRYDLDSVSKDRIGVGKEYGHLRSVMDAHRWTTDDELKRNLFRLPGTDVGEYAEGDVDRPLRVLKVQLEALEADGQMHVYDMERGLIPVLLEMRLRGVRVDLNRAVAAREQLVKERETHVKELKRLAGPRAELMQPESFVAALEASGPRVPRTPKTDRPSITDAWLRAQSSPLARAISAGRKVNTLINTFMDGHILGHAVGDRIYCEFPQLKGEDEGGDRAGTIARFSSRNPNLQNVPSRDKVNAPLIRGIFIPEDGEDWVRADECLTGDTMIQTIEGAKCIRDLVLHPVPVLSVSQDLRKRRPESKSAVPILEFKKVTRSILAGFRPTYKLTMENGAAVECTADHSWINLRNVKVKTSDLKIGDRLSHVHVNCRAYPNFWLNSNRNHYPIHRLVMEYHEGSCPEGHEVDHIDGVHFNWFKENLRYLPISINRAQGNPRWWNKASDRQRHNKIRILKENVRIKRRSYFGEGNPNYGKDWCRSRRWITNGVRSKRISELEALPTGWRYGRSIGDNHRLVSIEYIGIRPVYHITVEDNHTFVLTNGLVSSNSQVEYRFTAQFAIGRGAEEARRRYIEDPTTDYHDLVAHMQGEDPEDGYVRKRIKTLNFAKINGAGAERIAEMLGCSEYEAQEFIDKYDEQMPFARATYRGAQEWAARKGVVTTIIGRKQRFVFWEPIGRKGALMRREAALAAYGPRIRRAWAHKAFNRKIQGSAAEVIKKSMKDYYDRGLCSVLGAPLLTVHDELDVSAPRTAAAAEAVLEMKRIMEQCIIMDVPLMAELDRGSDWGNPTEEMKDGQWISK